MKTKVMRNLFFVCTVMLMLLSTSFLVSARPEQNIQKQSLFNLMFVMGITGDGNATQEPIHVGELRIVQFNIMYTVTRGAFGKVLFRLLEDRTFPMKISIEDKSEWCTAILPVEDFTGVISSDEIRIVHATLFIQLHENAPVNNTLGYVKIHGQINDLQGPYHILTLVQRYETNITFPFITSA
jgi:hypothetical protein